VNPIGNALHLRRLERRGLDQGQMIDQGASLNAALATQIRKLLARSRRADKLS